MTPEQLQREREIFEREILVPLFNRFLADGEFVVGPDGKLIDPERVRFEWTDEPINPVKSNEHDYLALQYVCCPLYRPRP